VGKRRGGPIPKLTPERHKLVVESLAAGVPRVFAAMRAGITERCLYQWLAKGRKGGKRNELYVQLFQAIQKAEADAVARNVAIVQKAASKSWQAAAWWLERRYHAEFGRKDRTVIQPVRKGDLGAEVRRRLDEADGGGHRQPGEAGGACTQELADPTPPPTY
jgi:hypothetical protein